MACMLNTSSLSRCASTVWRISSWQPGLQSSRTSDSADLLRAELSGARIWLMEVLLPQVRSVEVPVGAQGVAPVIRCSSISTFRTFMFERFRSNMRALRSTGQCVALPSAPWKSLWMRSKGISVGRRAASLISAQSRDCSELSSTMSTPRKQFRVNSATSSSCWHFLTLRYHSRFWSHSTSYWIWSGLPRACSSVPAFSSSLLSSTHSSFRALSSTTRSAISASSRYSSFSMISRQPLSRCSYASSSALRCPMPFSRLTRVLMSRHWSSLSLQSRKPVLFLGVRAYFTRSMKLGFFLASMQIQSVGVVNRVDKSESRYMCRISSHALNWLMMGSPFFMQPFTASRKSVSVTEYLPNSKLVLSPLIKCTTRYWSGWRNCSRLLTIILALSMSLSSSFDFWIWRISWESSCLRIHFSSACRICWSSVSKCWASSSRNRSLRALKLPMSWSKASSASFTSRSRFSSSVSFACRMSSNTFSVRSNLSVPSFELSLMRARSVFEPYSMRLTWWPLCASNIRQDGQIMLGQGQQYQKQSVQQHSQRRLWVGHTPMSRSYSAYFSLTESILQLYIFPENSIGGRLYEEIGGGEECSGLLGGGKGEWFTHSINTSPQQIPPCLTNLPLFSPQLPAYYYPKMSWPLHNDFTFPLNSSFVWVSSNFDGGNLESASFTGPSELSLLPGFDCLGEESLKPSSKTFFHFRVSTESKVRLTLRVGRVRILKRLFEVRWVLTEDGELEQYRVCHRRKREKEYSRLEAQPTIEADSRDELTLVFSYDFQDKDEVYFALNFPYGYVRMLELVRRLQAEFRTHSEIYLAREVLTYSLEGRLVPVLTITSHDHKTGVPEQRISNALFPESILESRPWKFRKPVVMVTCRVHPGEAPASYALEGLLEFLVSTQDFRACVLRRLFTFVVVPMLNPDGVHRGMYRMDTRGQNLNRFYSAPQSHKHPSIFAVRSLLAYYERENKMFAYFDLHAHSRRAGFFLYGNACSEYAQFVEARLFARLMAANCSQFAHDLCNYSQAQMTFKDSVEVLSKEGCGRVVAYRLTGITHAYALELGMHSGQRNQLAKEANTENKYEGMGCGSYEEDGSGMFTQASFKEGGRALLISLLDVVGMNPYSRLDKGLEGLRQQVAKEAYDREERFKLLDPVLAKKLRNINQIAKETLQSNLTQRFAHREALPRLESPVRRLTSKTPEPATLTLPSEENSYSGSTGASEQLENSSPEKSPEKCVEPKEMVFEARIREFRRKVRGERTKSTLKEPVGRRELERRMKEEEELVKLLNPMKIDLSPLPRVDRRKPSSFSKKEQFGEGSSPWTSLNLPQLPQPPGSFTSRRPAIPVIPTVPTTFSSPFTMQLRIRRKLDLKYGLQERRASLPEQRLL